MGIYSVVFVYRLLDNNLPAVDNVQAFNWSVNFSAGEIVNGFHLSVLTMCVFRDPRGVTYTTLRATCHYAHYRNYLRFISQQPSCRR